MGCIDYLYARANYIVGVHPDDIIDGEDRMLGAERSWLNPFGDGTLARKIISVLWGVHEVLSVYHV